MNQFSTAGFVPPSVYIGFRLFVLLGETFKRRIFDALGSTRKDCFLGEQFCWHPVLRDPAPPPRRAPRRDPPVVCSGFGLDGFVRASRDTPRRSFFHRKRGCCLLVTIPSACCAALARPAPLSRRAAPLSDSLGVCPGFELDKYFRFYSARYNWWHIIFSSAVDLLTLRRSSVL